ncbi:MAG: hypothetical protein ACRC28_16175 [Clostridium sp.]|uniref:hypothetical protein n=1 Tax=Clostridium sp. TaxID=1506 RepID=UPI003F2F21BC
MEKNKQGGVTDVNPTKKICLLKVDSKLLDMLDEVVGDFIKTHPCKNMTDVVRILQSVQLSYQTLTAKDRPKSEWLANIHKKITELDAKKALLCRYKEDSTTLNSENLKEARRLMASYGLILAKTNDLTKIISHLSDRSTIYADKIIKWDNRKKFRMENTKFELFRGRFYRDLSEEAKPKHKIPAEDIITT